MALAALGVIGAAIALAAVLRDHLQLRAGRAAGLAAHAEPAIAASERDGVQ
jgi:hypothetical protein